MDHVTIDQALNRIFSLSGNAGILADADATLAAKDLQNLISTLSTCVNHLAQVIKSIATKQHLMSDEGGYKF